MKRKIAATLCTALMSACLLSSCGGNTAATEAPAETSAATAAETTAETSAESEAASEAEGNAAASTDEILSDSTVAGWHIVVENTEASKSLENVSVDLGYTGVETSDFVKEASEGNVYYLIKLKIDKENSTEVIDWASLKLTDSEGNGYTRIEDEFITDLGMMRMPGTTLNFGSNEGWIAFEISENASGLQLSYPFEAETYTCDLPDIQ